MAGLTMGKGRSRNHEAEKRKSLMEHFDGKGKKMLCDGQDKLFAETPYFPWKWKAEDFR